MHNQPNLTGPSKGRQRLPASRWAAQSADDPPKVQGRPHLNRGLRRYSRSTNCCMLLATVALLASSAILYTTLASRPSKELAWTDSNSSGTGKKLSSLAIDKSVPFAGIVKHPPPPPPTHQDLLYNRFLVSITMPHSKSGTSLLLKNATAVWTGKG